MLLYIAFIHFAAVGVLLAFAIRGRTIARGRFCRRCKFDLAGLGLSTTPACPECGNPLGRPNATASRIRRTHKPTLAVAAVLLLLFGGYIVANMLPMRSGLYTHLPDWTVIQLDALGIDTALTEIAARSDIFPHFSKDHWDTLLARGLAHQADTSEPWDPRWGRVLANAFLRQQMTQAQMTAYVDNGLVVRVSIRDRIRADRPEVGVKVTWSHERFHASFAPLGLTGHGLGGAGRASIYDVHHTVVRSGIVGDAEPAPTAGVSAVQSIFMVPGGPFAETFHAPYHIGLPNTGRAGSKGEVRVFVEIGTSIRLAGGGPEIVSLGPTRFEQTVVLLPPQTEIISVVRDDAAAQAIREGALLSDVIIAQGDPEATSMRLRLATQGRAIAGNLFAVIDGVETRITSQLTLKANGSSWWSINPRLMPYSRPESDTIRMLERWADRGSMDFVFRTDPDAAYDNPDIQEVVDLTLWFRNIPVTSVPPNTPRPSQTFHGAAPAETPHPAEP